MEPERWREIERVYHLVREQSAARRGAFLEQTCGGDEELLREVESLLSCGDGAEEYIKAGVLEAAAQPRDLPGVPAGMIGQTVSHYRVVEKLGGGGMGVVYRAEDLRLHRKVALKLLTDNLAEDRLAVERFEREARSAAALNHPNICVVYEIGEHQGRPFIAMELLDGRTLKERMGAQPLQTDELLDWAVQIAGGLEAAHQMGIVHRDIKPANIFITGRGQAKIVDFGLAKVAAPSVSAAGAAGPTSLPTGDHLTSPGIAVGTVPYMSPEQARGEELDARTDLFSFGAVLYEMATGKAAFAGATTAIIQEAILGRSSAPVYTVNARMPRELDRIIGKALEKDRDLRYQHAADVCVDLKRLKRDTESGRAEAISEPEIVAPSRLRLWLFASIPLIVLAVGVFYQVWKPLGLFRTLSLPAQPTYRQISFVGDATYPALSSDGKFVAYVTGEQGQEQKLMLQDLRDRRAIEISKASDAIWNPRWSPDDAEIAVYRSDAQQGGIFLIPRLGGPPRYIAGGLIACWSPDGNQIAAAWQNEGGFRIVDKVTGRAKSIHLNGFRWIADLDWSPASNFVAVLTTLDNGSRAIWTVRPDGSELRKVIEEDGLASPRWSAGGDGIYFLQSSHDHPEELLKVAINPKSGQAKDPPAALLNGLQVGGYFTVSADGTHLGYSRSQDYSNLWLAQFQSPDNGNGTGKELRKGPVTRGTSRFDTPSISPDGDWIAYVTEGHIHTMASEGGAPKQLTFSNATEFSPAWSPDSERIAFGSNESGTYQVSIVDADGSNRRQFAKTQLSAYDLDGFRKITWSPGRHILYQKPGNRNFNILDPETAEEKPLVQNESVGWLFEPVYSPDGRKVAVFWNRRQAGIWVISLIDNAETFVSSCRYCLPAGWSLDSKSVYAVNYPPSNTLLSIPTAGGPPHTVLTAPGDIGGASVSADGKKFAFPVREMKSDAWVVDNFDPAYRK